MTIQFYLSRPGTQKQPNPNFTTIYARICYQGRKFKYYIPEKIRPHHWNPKKRMAIQSAKFPEHPEFNQRLINIEATIRNTLRKFQNENGGKLPSTGNFRDLLDQLIKPTEDQLPRSFFNFFSEIISLSERGGRVQAGNGKQYSPATIQVYKTTYQRLKDYQSTIRKKIDFETISVDFHNDYTEYLKGLQLSTNTIGKDIKVIKAIMNEATERGINVNLQYRSRKFIKPTEETESIYLTKAELFELEELDLSSNPRLDIVRDRFLVGCYTGLRFSDYSILTSQNIKDGYFEITQTKTGDKIAIPVHPVVKRIFQKYNGNLPRAITNQKTNEYLKEIGKLIPGLSETFTQTITKGGAKIIRNHAKWELLTTHTARRSFATNGYLDGIPTITLMAITGHKTEKSFLRYLKLTPKDHAKIIQQHWDNSNHLKAV